MGGEVIEPAGAMLQAMDALSVSPLSAVSGSSASPASAGSRMTGAWFAEPLSVPAGPPCALSAGGAPWELWARALPYIDDPASFAASCRLFRRLAGDPVLRRNWFVARFGAAGAVPALLWRHPRLFTPAVGKAIVAAARKHAERRGWGTAVPRWWLQLAVRGLVAAGSAPSPRLLANGVADAGNQADQEVDIGQLAPGVGEESPVVPGPPVPNNTPTDPQAIALQVFTDTPDNDANGLSPIPPLIPLSPVLLTRVNVGGVEPIRINLSGKKASALLTFLVVLANEEYGSKSEMTGDDFAELMGALGLAPEADRLRADPAKFVWPIRLEREAESPIEVLEGDTEDDADMNGDIGLAGVQAAPAQALPAAAPAPEAALPPPIAPPPPAHKVTSHLRRLFVHYSLPLSFGRLPLLPVHPVPTLFPHGRFSEAPDLMLRTWNPLFEAALRDPRLLSRAVETGLDAGYLDGAACGEMVARLVLHVRWRAEPEPEVVEAVLDACLRRPVHRTWPREPVLDDGQVAWLLERLDLFDDELCAPACRDVAAACRVQDTALGGRDKDAGLVAASLAFLKQNPTSLFALFERFRGHLAAPAAALEAFFAEENIRTGATRNRFVTPFQVARKLASYLPVWDGMREVMADYVGSRSTTVDMFSALFPFADSNRLSAHRDLFTLAGVPFSDAIVLYASSSGFLRTDPRFHRDIVTRRWAPFLPPGGPERCARGLLAEMRSSVEDFAVHGHGEPRPLGLLGEVSVLFYRALSYPFEWLAEAFPALREDAVDVLVRAIAAGSGIGKLRSGVAEATACLRKCWETSPGLVLDPELMHAARRTRAAFPEDREFLKVFFEMARERVRSCGAEEKDKWREAAEGMARDKSGEGGGALGFGWWLSSMLLPDLR